MAEKNVVNMTIKANMDISQMSAGITQMQGILQKLKLPSDIKRQFDGLFSAATTDLEKYQSKLQSGFKTKGDVTGLEKIGRSLEATFSSIEKEWAKLQGLDISKIVNLEPSSQARIKEIENSFKTLGAELKSQVAPNLQNITTLINQLNTKSSKKGGAQITELLGAGQYEQAITLLDQLILKQQKAVDSFDKGDKNAGVRGQTLQQYEAIRQALDQVIPKIQEYNSQANNLQSEKIQIFANATQKANTLLQQGANVAANTAEQMRKYGNAAQQSAQQTQQLGYDLDMIKSRIQYFFSLTNGAMLFRRVLQDTIQTTKELDAAMTETAVVTDFSVGDMWKELPRYTALAKELGSTIQGVYETMTLYYQQGLETNEVFEVGTETLKMARIAGLDYAKATDFMTAALRGFNMEVNEINAQKINDVYSELAAITAADTQEIATAMTKTASIASNANMEFETTAAFLSQIIETTRESAETAGTAMKTVIARFTELKKDPAEIGEVDGEIVDANKIETALRTINVALRDTSGQFRDLDDVFLDIAEKWDGLDTNTQRYIATMAAGSRQQSRFIAMMSDYNRTMELVNAANNSAGASQKQFDKTLESLEAKLNQLKDAWDEFTMGIANNTLIKAGIDALTNLLELINSLTKSLPGPTKGIGNLLLMIGGFAAGKKVMGAFFASTLNNIVSLGKVGAEGGTAYGLSFNAALKKELGKTGALIKGSLNKKTWFNTGTMAINARKGAGGILRERLQAEGELKTLKNARATSTLPYSQQTAAIAAQEAQIKKLQAAEQAYYGASIPQQNAYLALKNAGLTTEQAQIALTKELTEEDYKQLAVQSLMNSADYVGQELTEEEIKARIALIKAKQAELNADKMGLATKAKNLAMLLFGTQAMRQKALANFAAAGATWAQKGAQDGLNASMLACPIGWIIAGIGLLVGGLILLYKWAEKQTLEYRMEKVAEATEKAKEAAESAKESYDNLNASIEEIGTKKSELENLTYGTLEWQRALLEVNQQVMDLIDQFPDLREELLNELTVKASGELVLSQTDQKMMQEYSLQQYKNAVIGQSVTQSEQAQLEYEAAEKAFKETKFTMVEIDSDGEKISETTGEQVQDMMTEVAVGYKSDAQRMMESFESLFNLIFRGGKKTESQEIRGQALENIQADNRSEYQAHSITDFEKSRIQEKYLSNPEIFSNGNEELEKFAKELEVSTDSILKFIPVIRQLEQAELEREAYLRSQINQIALAAVSEDFKNRKDSNGIVDTFSDVFSEEKDLEVEREASVFDDLEFNFTDYAEKLGINDFVDKGNDSKNLYNLYSQLTGKTTEEIEEEYGENLAELKKAIARIKVGKDWGKRVENFATELDKFSKELGDTEMADLIAGIFGGADGTGLNKADIDKYKNNKEEAESELYNLYTNSNVLKEQFKDFDAFQKYYQQQITDANKIYVDATQKLTAFGIEIGDISKTLSSGVLKGLSEHLTEIANITSPENAEAIAKTLSEVTAGMTEAEIESFYSQLNALDWSSIQSLDGLKHSLRDLGIYVPEDKLKNLTNQIKEFGKASNAVDLGQLTQQLISTQDLIDDISSRERGEYTFSEEDKNKIIDTGFIDSDMFVGYGDSWRYVGDNLDALIEALHQNTIAILEDTKGKLEDQIKTAQVANNSGIDYSDAAALETSKKQELLNKTLAYIETYNSGVSENDKITNLDGYSLDALSNIANSENLETSQVEFLDSILQSLADKSTIEALERLEAQYASANREAGMLNYLNQPTSTIATAATATVDPNAANAAEQQTEVDNATNALLYKARAYAELDDEIRAYNDALATNNEETIKEAKKTLAAQLAIEEKAKALDDLDDKVEDHLDALKEINKDTEAYDEQLGDLAEDLSDAFDMDLDSTFFSDNGYENLKLLEQAIKGSQSAWEQLIINMQTAKLASDDFVNTYGLNADQVANITTALDNLDYDINGYADMTQVIQQLIAAGWTAADIAAFIEDLGNTNVEFVVDNNVVGLDKLADPAYWDQVKGSIQLRAQNVNVPAARRSSSFGGGGRNSGSKGGGGGSKDSNKWENPYDSFYNINEDINELLDERNQLEKDYELLLQDQNASIDDYLNSYKDRIASYREEIELQRQALEMRKEEQQSLLNKNKDLQKYAWVEDGKVKIDYDAINKVTDEELGERIEKYVERLEENDEAIQEAEETIKDNTLAIENLMDEWRDKAADFEQEVYDALIHEREQEIERFEDIADSIEDTTDNLISAIQEEIDTRRQQRDNEETEEEIAKKERRLAYLQRDTSGANRQEILSLEDELSEERRDYTDTLIDQKISELEKQNDEAKKQREKQIQILQFQLKNDQETGVIASQVYDLLKDANSSEGWNRVWKLLESSAGFSSLTETNKAVWIEKTQANFKEAMAYLNGTSGGGIASDIANSKSTVNYNYYGNGDTITSGEVSGGDTSGTTPTTPTKSTTPTKPTTPTTVNSPKPKAVSMTKTDISGTKYYKVGSKWYKASDTTGLDQDEGTTTLKEGAKGVNNIMVSAGTTTAKKITYFLTDKDAKNYMSKNVSTKKFNGKTYYVYNGQYYGSNPLEADYDVFPFGANINLKGGVRMYKKYATGGLADYTGPAWLDGTKSRPELVLNQKDTQNFLQLKDVLGSFMKNRPAIDNSNSTGDTSYEVSINVENVSSDYDVEKMATKIKQLIHNDAMYRNSNIISRLR